MTFLLREILLQSLGIESDINWLSTDEGLSAVNMNLVPPGSGALIKKIVDLGKTYKFLEDISGKQVSNSYKQAIYDSIDSYLDFYRTSVLEADQKICNKLITTTTGLLAHLDPFQHELHFVGKIVPKLLSVDPIEMLNLMHNYVITSPNHVSQKLSSFEQALHQVTIHQLDGFVFFHQALPEIFTIGENTDVIYSNNTDIGFIPQQLSNLLLLIINIASHCPDLFDKTDPPVINQLPQWIAAVSTVTSALLSERLNELWPSYQHMLSRLVLFGREDFVSAIAHELIDQHVNTSKLTNLISSFKFKTKITVELTKLGLSIRTELESPLDLIIVYDHQVYLDNLFKFLIMIETALEALKDLWILTKKNRKYSNTFISCLKVLLWTIKHYILSVVVLPSLTILVNASKNIEDFLHFKGEFSNFMLRMMSFFDAADVEIQNSAFQLNQGIVELHRLLIGKDVASELDDNGLLIQLVENLTDLLIQRTRIIVDKINMGDDEGIQLSIKHSRIVATIESLREYCARVNH